MASCPRCVVPTITANLHTCTHTGDAYCSLLFFLCLRFSYCVPLRMLFSSCLLTLGLCQCQEEARQGPESEGCGRKGACADGEVILMALPCHSRFPGVKSPPVLSIRCHDCPTSRPNWPPARPPCEVSSSPSPSTMILLPRSSVLSVNFSGTRLHPSSVLLLFSPIWGILFCLYTSSRSTGRLHTVYVTIPPPTHVQPSSSVCIVKSCRGVTDVHKPATGPPLSLSMIRHLERRREERMKEGWWGIADGDG